MNTKRVNAAADVIHRAMQQGKTLPVSLATALDATCMLQSPETAAEMETFRDTTSKILAHAAEQLGLACQRITELETERHSTNEALSDAAEALRVSRDRIAELEAAPSRDAVLAEVAVWLGKKAREFRSTRSRQHALQAETLEQMASKIRRGAVRPAAPHLATAGELAEQRHLVDPLDHALEALAPRSLPTLPQQLDRRAL